MKIMYTVMCFVVVVVVKLVVHVVESTQTMTSLYMYNEPRTVSLKGKEFITVCYMKLV